MIELVAEETVSTSQQSKYAEDAKDSYASLKQRERLGIDMLTCHDCLELSDDLWMLIRDIVHFANVLRQIVQLDRRIGILLEINANGLPVADASCWLRPRSLNSQYIASCRGCSSDRPSSVGTIEMPSSFSGVFAPANSQNVGSMSQ